jgi:pyruvate ferredoxin oxidoreductase gamma subunit
LTAGLKESGAVIINTSKSPDEIRSELGGYKGKVCTIDGKYFPNMPMLAAVVKVSGVMADDAFIKDMQTTFSSKFASKPQVIEGNMNAIKRAITEVKGL